MLTTLEIQGCPDVKQRPQLFEVRPEILCIDIDALPELQSVRLQARREAYEILERNRQHLRDGEFGSVPLPVDALGTARRVVAVGNEYGVGSGEHTEIYEGLRTDCRKLVAETFRKNTWEYFGKEHQPYDKATGQFFSRSQTMLEIVANGLSPVAEPEEQDRRNNNFVEQATRQTLKRLPKSDNIRAIKISQCTDWAIESLTRNPLDGHGGYVPEIEKIMIDCFEIDDAGGYQEQIGISGKIITNDIINQALRILGVVETGKTLSKTEIHAKQLLVSNELAGSVIDFVQILDGVAGEVTGLNVFLGEEVATGHPKDYSRVVEEAAARQQKQEEFAGQLTDYLIKLEEKGTDHQLAGQIVEDYIKEHMLGIARKDPDQAETIFNQATADGFRAVARLEALGDQEAAQRLNQEVERSAPPPAFCGAGSCGLEAVGLASLDGAKAHTLGLKGELLHDKIRACPGCGEKKIYYDKKGNKACTGCEHSQVNGKIQKSKNTLKTFIKQAA